MRKIAVGPQLIATLSLFLGAVLFVAPRPDESPEATAGLLILLFAAALFPILIEFASGKFDCFEMKNLFVAYFLLQLGVFPIIALLGASSRTGSSGFLRAEDINSRLFYTGATDVALMGILFFNAGYYARTGRALGRRLPSLPSWRAGPTVFLSALFIVIGTAATFYFFSLFGGVREFLGNLGYWRSYGMIGQGYLIFPMTVILPMGPILLFIHEASRGGAARAVGRNLLLFAASLIPCVLLGFRGSLVPLLLQLMTIWHFLYRPLPLRRVILLGLSLLVVLTAYGVLRNNLDALLNERAEVSMAGVDSGELLTSVILRSPGSDMAQRVIGQIDQTHEYQYWWRGFLETATIVVPHVLWDSKPMPTGLKFGRDFMGEFVYQGGYVGDATGGFSPTCIGFFYWQMGMSGVALGMALIGLLARLVYEYLLAEPKDPTRVLVYSSVFGVFALTAESPQDIANGTLLRLLLVAALLTFVARTRKTSSARARVPGRMQPAESA